MAPKTDEVIFREFQAGDETAFRRLNEEWILRYFAMEPKDEATLGDPRSTILARGGRIFLAVSGGEAIGCCALLATAPGEFELAKMAVTASCQGRGVGRRLLAAAIDAARDSGAARLFLETNDRMTPAIHLYEALGFRHFERTTPSPYARSNVNMEMWFGGGK